jgi:hypothetical protein
MRFISIWSNERQKEYIIPDYYGDITPWLMPLSDVGVVVVSAIILTILRKLFQDMYYKVNQLLSISEM